MRQTEGNPLAAGLIAFGGGLLAASLLPVTQPEREAGQQLKDSDVMESAKQAATESGQRIADEAKHAAQQSAEQIKDTATEAAKATGQDARHKAGQVKDQTRESAQQVSDRAKDN